MIRIAFLLLSMVLTTAVVAVAQEVTPRADVREGAQRARIREGRKDGDLTRREAKGLNRQQRHIRRSERRAKADGTVTGAEKRKLERKQDRASRTIRKAKTNSIKK